MTNREFIFTELFILGLEHIYGPMGYEKHNFSLLDIKHGVSNALHEGCYTPKKHFEKGLRILESYGVLKIIFKTTPSYMFTIAFVNDPDKWEKFYNDVPEKHKRRIKKIIDQIR